MALILQEVGFLFCLNTVKNMQPTDLKPICIFFFLNFVFTCSGSWILEFLGFFGPFSAWELQF